MADYEYTGSDYMKTGDDISSVNYFFVPTDTKGRWVVKDTEGKERIAVVQGSYRSPERTGRMEDVDCWLAGYFHILKAGENHRESKVNADDDGVWKCCEFYPLELTGKMAQSLSVPFRTQYAAIRGAIEAYETARAGRRLDTSKEGTEAGWGAELYCK